MSEDKLTREAKDFVDRVIELNRDHGGVVDLSAEERHEIVRQAAAPFRSLREKVASVE